VDNTPRQPVAEVALLVFPRRREDKRFVLLGSFWLVGCGWLWDDGLHIASEHFIAKLLSGVQWFI